MSGTCPLQTLEATVQRSSSGAPRRCMVLCKARRVEHAPGMRDTSRRNVGRSVGRVPPDEAEQSSDILTFPLRVRRSYGGPMPTYLVETFLARDAASERHARELRATSAAETRTREGTCVHYSGSIHVPEDELCLFTFEAPSRTEAAHVARLAGLEALRVVEAIPSEEARK
jgi:hypothetical protein